MLIYSGITVLSFANKVVKVQPQKFVRSLSGVPRTLQYFQSGEKKLNMCTIEIFTHMLTNYVF